VGLAGLAVVRERGLQSFSPDRKSSNLA
jgi:hypothetical protein